MMGFDRPVAPDGYAWWYVDALSDDGQHGITLIAFLGSVFSPWYAWARRRRGPADPLAHCALNVALYGRPRRWALTERPRGAVTRNGDHLRIGRSALAWDGAAALTIHIDEVTAPIPTRVRGTVKVWPEAGALGERSFALDQAGRHRWTPLAPVARVEVALEQPALRWSGPAYLDSNEGDAPLERDFVEWDWCRAPTPGGTAILYEATRQDGSVRCLSLLARPGGDGLEEIEPPPPCALPPTAVWRVPRRTRAEPAAQQGAPPPPAARVLRTLEDTPFYSRSVLATRLARTDATAVHESLHLRRFSHPLVQAMLPFRVPRARR